MQPSTSFVREVEEHGPRWAMERGVDAGQFMERWRLGILPVDSSCANHKRGQLSRLRQDEVLRGLPLALAPFQGMSDAGDLIRGWIDHARYAGNSFEGFIYGWIAYNAWAAHCTAIDADWLQNEVMATSSVLREEFDELLTSDAGFEASATRFHSLWPIFRASELRSRHLRRRQGEQREAMRERYVTRGVAFEPDCWGMHGGAIPIDWPHTLLAIYRVRCNLFHGEKSVDSEWDREIVDGARETLVPFSRAATDAPKAP